MRIRLLPLLIVIGLLAGCGGGDDESEQATPPAAPSAGLSPATVKDVAGQSFISTAVEGRELVSGTRVTLKFSPKTLGIQAGCNTTSGKYRIEGGRLEFKPGPSTLMGCPEDLLAQDRWLKEFLASAPTASFGSETLELDGPDGESITLKGTGRDPGV